jgi:hypothetical protein
MNSKPPKFAKVRASYKISSEYKESERNKKRRTQAKIAMAQKKKAAAAAEKKAASHADQETLLEQKLLQSQGLSPEQIAEIQSQKQQAALRKQQAEAKAIADQIKRRRFPMEDTKLHQEDKILGVKPPKSVQPRPALPYFWQCTLDPRRRTTGKTPTLILTASKVENLDTGSRGLVPDLLSVYHFFRGDVHFQISSSNDNHHDESLQPIVPPFTLQQLIFAVEQVLNGNARKAKTVPPLLVHLFVTSLQLLLLPPSDNNNSTNELSKNEQKLRRELHEFLLPALTPASWGDVMYLYMDAMERYFTTDASRDPNVVPCYSDIDSNFLFGRTDQLETTATEPLQLPTSPTPAGADASEETSSPVSHPLPMGYTGYLGDPNGVLSRAHHKLARQDPWLLTAEEMMALLRALTEDILATHPAASRDFTEREDQLIELLKAKRVADAKFRKVRLEFEGPKKPTTSSVSSSTSKNKKGDSAKDDGENATDDLEDDTNKADKPFKPTVSKRQFEAAKKAQEKANDAYEKAVKNLVSRTEPVGFDRNHNAVYCFRHDPEVLYIEEKRPPSMSAQNIPADMLSNKYSWHVIETTSLFDQYIASLDVRGRREHDLFDALVGPQDSHQSLRKYLYDDVKEKADAKAKLKEMEALKERLKIAQIKCDEESGRRSGRLAGQAEMELMQIQMEIADLEKCVAGQQITSETQRNYLELTGYDLLKKFETESRIETRRTREKKAEAKARKIPFMYCSKIYSTGNIDGTGIVGMMVNQMLDIEERCNALVPWDRTDETRSAWIAKVENAVHAWNDMCPDLLESKDLAGDLGRQRQRDSVDSSDNASSKRRKLDCPSPAFNSSNNPSANVSSIIAMLKQPLLDLEERVADITNVAFATRDADLADDNMSTQSADEDDEGKKERLEKAWKKLVQKLRETPTKKHVQIRELLVAAIGAARKAHLPSVVTALRAALLLWHPHAASESKNAAIKILEENGGYEEDDDDEEEEAGNEDQAEDDEFPSVLSAEAALLRSSLGSVDATREDWIKNVKSVKTLSRLASLVAAFFHDTTTKLQKIEIERDALTRAIASWTRADERARDGKNKKIGTNNNNREKENPSEVWANVQYTDEIIMAKADEFPWWPAKKVVANDADIARSLLKVDRLLVAFIGEMGGLRVVRSTDIRPFTGRVIEQEEDIEYTKEVRSELDDCMAMARRIQRGLQKLKK